MISVSELRAAINSSEDKLNYQRLRDTVIQYIEQYCNRHLNAYTGKVDTILNTRCKPFLYLRGINITEITLVEIWSKGQGPVDAIAFTDFWLDDERSRLARNDGGAFDYYVRVTYTGGYNNDTVPAKLKDAILLQAQFMVDRNSKEAGKLISRNQAFEAGSVWYQNPGMHKQVKDWLQGFKKATIR